MDFILRSLMTLLIDGVAVLCDMVGVSVLSMLTMDIGSGGSLFEQVFTEITNWSQVFIYMAMAILFMIAVVHLFFSMASADGSAEPPLALVFRVLMAGIMIYIMPKLLNVAQQFFGMFYDIILTGSVAGGPRGGLTVTFSDMTNSLRGLDWDSVLGVGVLGTGIGIGGTLLLLIMILLIGIQFIKFIIECVERYVLLGIMLYTSPIACAMAGSKTTSNTFFSWLRMVLSQMFLMVTNALCFRLFLIGMMNMNNTISTFGSRVPFVGGPSVIAVSFVWTVMLYAILYIGCSMDSFLASLGLSTAQCGQGLSSSMMFSTMMMTRMVTTGVRMFQGRGGSSGGKGGANPTKPMPPQHNPSTGGMTAGSVVRQSQGNVPNKYTSQMRGQAAGMGFQEGMSNVPHNVAQGVIPRTFDGQTPGAYTMNWQGERGQTAQITAVPMSGKYRASAGIEQYAGRQFTLQGDDGSSVSMMGIARGDGAAEFLTSNPQMNERMAEFSAKRGCTATEVSPGVWHTTQVGANGEVVKAQEYAAASVYKPDVAANSHVERIGDMDYHVSDITPMAQGQFSMPVGDGGDIQSSFPALAGQEIPSFSFPESAPGTFTYESGGVNYAAAPVSEYALQPGMDRQAETIVATNGAQYTVVNCGDQQPDIASVFVTREAPLTQGVDGQLTGVVAQPKPEAPADLQAYIAKKPRSTASVLADEAAQRARGMKHKR